MKGKQSVKQVFGILGVKKDDIENKEESDF